MNVMRGIEETLTINVSFLVRRTVGPLGLKTSLGSGSRADGPGYWNCWPLGPEDRSINVNNAFTRQIPTILKSAPACPPALACEWFHRSVAVAMPIQGSCQTVGYEGNETSVDFLRSSSRNSLLKIGDWLRSNS